MAPRRWRGGRAARSSLAALAFAALAHGPALAHENRPVGGLEIVVGWLEEPTLAGYKNGVQLIVSRAGEPVQGGRLGVVVMFGGRNSDTRSEPLALEPRPLVPGQYVAGIIPTRPGRYTFQVTGRIGGQRINEVFTSGPRSFHDVENPTEAQFPTREPTAAELAERLDRLDARIQQALSPPPQSVESSANPHVPTLILGGAGALLGALALAITMLRRTPRGT